MGNETKGKPITTANAEAIAASVAAFVDNRLAGTATKEDIPKRPGVCLTYIVSSVDELEPNFYDNPLSWLAFVTDEAKIYYGDADSRQWKPYAPFNLAEDGTVSEGLMLYSDSATGYPNDIVVFHGYDEYHSVAGTIDYYIKDAIKKANFALTDVQKAALPAGLPKVVLLKQAPTFAGTLSDSIVANMAFMSPVLYQDGSGFKAAVFAGISQGTTGLKTGFYHANPKLEYWFKSAGSEYPKQGLVFHAVGDISGTPYSSSHQYFQVADTNGSITPITL